MDALAAPDFRVSVTDDMAENTLEELEGEIWNEPDYGSYLATSCHNLRKKPVDEFTVEDLRIMIGQNIDFSHLMPKAIEVLEANPLVMGDYYAGDLLSSVIAVDDDFLHRNRNQASKIISIAESAISSTEPIDDDLKAKLRFFIEKWSR